MVLDVTDGEIQALKSEVPQSWFGKATKKTPSLSSPYVESPPPLTTLCFFDDGVGGKGREEP